MKVMRMVQRRARLCSVRESFETRYSARDGDLPSEYRGIPRIEKRNIDRSIEHRIRTVRPTPEMNAS